jgi:hypothetical protein
MSLSGDFWPGPATSRPQPVAGVHGGEWISWAADCPCGLPATWHARPIGGSMLAAWNRPAPQRASSVEYHIDCRCPGLQAMAA